MISHPLIHEPGVFMGMPEEEYHRALALSASGIKWLRVSSLDWWARSPLNPEYVEEENEAFKIGKAFHARIVEGAAVFRDRYAAALDPADYPDALRTNEDLRQAIIDAGGPSPKTSSRKSDLIDLLTMYSGAAVIWERVVQAHAERCGERIILPADLIRRIEIAAGYIEKHPDLGRAFTGGYPEVSCFWNDEETGIPMKCRIDYLKPRAIVDLKTISGERAIPLERAAVQAIANYGYYLQATFYLDAMKVFEPDVDRTFLFLFQRSGIAPVARGYVFGHGTVMDIARQQIGEAKEQWRRCWDTYGPDTPWVDMAEITTLDDMAFPGWIGS